MLPPSQSVTRAEYLPPQALWDNDKLKENLGDAPEIPTALSGTVERYLPQCILIDLELEAIEPLLVVGYTPKIEAGSERPTDAAFVTRLRLQAPNKPVDEIFLPGSSLKGVLRTRVKRLYARWITIPIIPARRTPGGIQKAQEAYLGRISACAVTHALAPGETPSRLNACFGGEQRMQNTENQAEASLYEHSCLACRVFGNTTLRGRLVVEEGKLLSTGKSKLFDHVAIDRFSGGAADAKKFDDRPLLPGERS